MVDENSKPGTEFVEFPKISRYSREVVVTEKIDGTNASVHIPDGDVCDCGHVIRMHDNAYGCCGYHEMGDVQCSCPKFVFTPRAYAGSRTRWITPQDDNMGFAKWVAKNQEELLKLGPGTHFGEWWGAGIQRGYGLKEKRFSLFNVTRWGDPATRPACCGVVPVLWEGLFDQLDVDEVMRKLEENGSYAAPGFKKGPSSKGPEGIVIFCTAGGQLFKKTFEKDVEGKGKDR